MASLPMDLIAHVLSYHGPLSELPASHRRHAAAVRIQRAARAAIRSVRPLEPGARVLLRHAGRWARGLVVVREPFELATFTVLVRSGGRLHYLFGREAGWRCRAL